MKASVPVFATKEWLEKNALAGNGEVRECQRRTKSWRLAKDAEYNERVAVRRVFRAGGLHAVVVSGCVRYNSYVALGYVMDYANTLNVSLRVLHGSVYVAIFTCDAATGVWHALVLFSKGGEA
jgi:hypothetical protein